MIRHLVLLLITATGLLASEPLSLDRIVVIGASVSRGFTKSEPFGGEKSVQLRFDRYLDAALTVPHGKIINDSNHLFFTAVEKEAGTQLDRLKRRDPTLVVAVDFLFWFLYGHPDRVGDRLAMFEKGLGMLEAIDAPLVVGDIPDTSAAVGHMLTANMVPTAGIRAEANQRLAEWAAERPQVSILSLSNFLKTVEAGSRLEVGPLTVEAGKTRELLQPDRLHPTAAGNAALALATLATLIDDGLSEKSVLWDPGEVTKATLAPAK